MHRIDGPGATIDGRFTEGDPTAGIPATTVTGAWLNAVQEEIAGVVEAAGDTLEKADNGQLAAAISALIAAAIAGIPTPDMGWSTGDVKLTMKAVADTGWLMCNDGTIGPSGSGATSRANADCQALFTLLWTNVADAYAPVSGGRGASAAADWAAGKTIALTRMLGRALGIAGAGASLTGRGLGEALGAETHVLGVNEIPAHQHFVLNNDSTSTGSPNVTAAQTVTKASSSSSNGSYDLNGTANPAVAGKSSSVGSGGAHNNMQPTAFLNAMVKL
jgi:microcystin-dependent protein